jgi:hypothetical protein
MECTDPAWRQAQLSMRSGRLGLRSLGDHSGEAFIASQDSAHEEPTDTPHLKATVDHYNQHVSDERILSGFDPDQ